MSRKNKRSLDLGSSDPEVAFLEELEAFRIDHEQAAQFFYAYLSIHATAGTDGRVYRMLDESALFWNTVAGGLQTASFIALGRVFDVDVQHGLYRALRIAQDHPDIFSKDALAKRKQKGLHAVPDWLPAFLETVVVPTPDDFRRIRRYLQKRKALYEEKHDVVRTHFAHRVLISEPVIDAAFAAVDIKETQQLLAFLSSLHRALWQMFYDGTKLTLRPERFSPKSMRRAPRPQSSVRERITHETERFLKAAAISMPGFPPREHQR